MACFSKYAGFRNADVLPYSAQAYGMAEQTECWSHYAFVGEAYSAIRKLAVDVTHRQSTSIARCMPRGLARGGRGFHAEL
eukprot:6210656-Pleurochrysis_carterae.AAC.6